MPTLEDRIAVLEARLAQSDADIAAWRIRADRAGRKLRAQSLLLSLFAAVGLCLAAFTPVGADGDTIASLAARLAVVESKTADMSIVQMPLSGGPSPTQARTVRFTNVNVQIVNGTGSTGTVRNQDGIVSTVNGRGNLIIGYQELRGDASDERRGSHNLVVGGYHSYTGSGGLVAGSFNTISGDNAFASGIHNTASGLGSSVSGGSNNTAAGQFSSVSGGMVNTAGNMGCSVSGGQQNTAGGLVSSISAGRENLVSSRMGSISGGRGIRLVTDGEANWAAGSNGTPASGQFRSP